VAKDERFGVELLLRRLFGFLRDASAWCERQQREEKD
jgi:hypothetical protein